MNIENQEILALLIVNKGGTFNSIYHLNKILGLKYKIGHPIELLNDLCLKGLLKMEIINQINYYYIAEDGNKEIDDNRADAISVINSFFPNDIDFTNTL